jgi:hypothetical protein
MSELRYDPKRGDRIPLAREELMQIASFLRDCGILEMEMPAAHIEAIVNELMWRRGQKKRSARPKQAPITSELVREVQAYLMLNPSKHDREIGQMYGIDGGRVSEISQGHRTVAYPGGTPEWRGLI